jgi:glyoxylase-like metal-dependent hydrolase (beta-lactamase superfamily II)
MSRANDATLVFPYPTAPDPGTVTEVAPGVLWLRLALPFALDHVNVYLIEDDEGWAVLDTGVCDDRTKDAWTAVIAGALGGRSITRVIATHFHPDHIGLAGWLVERSGADLLMSQTEFFFAQTLLGHPDAIRSPAHIAFFRHRGLDENATEALLGRGHNYLRMTSPVPTSYRRLAAGESIAIGGRSFEVLTGGGHAPEQVTLLCRAERLFFSADQVLARISPNISVWAWEPDADPLGAYLASLEALHESIPDRALVPPGHNLPFVGLQDRAADLAVHHARRCDTILAACAKRNLTGAELVPVLFTRPLDPQQTGFAFGETLAHVNYLLRRKSLKTKMRANGAMTYESV